jgi:hypothetical protein
MKFTAVIDQNRIVLAMNTHHIGDRGGGRFFFRGGSGLYGANNVFLGE